MYSASLSFNCCLGICGTLTISRIVLLYEYRNMHVHVYIKTAVTLASDSLHLRPAASAPADSHGAPVERAGETQLIKPLHIITSFSLMRLKECN